LPNERWLGVIAGYCFYASAEISRYYFRAVDLDLCTASGVARSHQHDLLAVLGQLRMKGARHQG
jgi:hypothetical protein